MANDRFDTPLDKHGKPLKKGSTAEVRDALRQLTVRAVWRLSEALDAEREVITLDANGNETINMVPDMRMRMEAIKVLQSTFIPNKQTIDLNVDGPKQPLDLSKLTDQELTALRVVERAQHRLREMGVGKDLIEVEALTPLAALPPLPKRG